MTANPDSDIFGRLDDWRHGVTIGIPLYNEEPYIEAAIRSAAPQCEVVLVSDNCSTDRSAGICQALAQEYPNVLFVRQAANIGAADNFKYVLNEARTPYFMWLGGHDLLPEGYVRRLRGVLDSDATSVLAYGAVRHVDRDGNEISNYDYYFSGLLADGQPATRLHGVVRHLFDCSLIHGLFRTAPLKAAWVDAHYLSCDHVLLANAAVSGKFLYEPAISLIRRDPHAHDTQEAQLERITGVKQKGRPQPTRREMQTAQYALVVQVSEQLGWRAPFFRLSARFWLVNRFGPFAETGWGRMLEKALRKIGRIVIKCRITTPKPH